MNQNRGFATALWICVLFSCLALPLHGRAATHFELRSTIVLTSTRDNPGGNPLTSAEIYLIDPDGTNPRRLTNNTDGEAFAALSPDGKKITFNSNRDRTADEPINTASVYLMNTDGSEQTLLLRGSSPTWSPDSKDIAYHASASGSGLPIKPDPGAATTDSDIFTLNVDDWLSEAEGPRNITKSPDAIDDDPDWSPDGKAIAFTSHPVTDDPINSVHAEIYTIHPDGTGLTRLTNNLEEERAPSWSPDGTRIVFMDRRGGPDFEICVMSADGSGLAQLTDNSVLDATPTWSPDGQKIVFHRPVAGLFQLWTMNPDGSGQTQLTFAPGLNLFANWGELRVRVPNETKHLAARGESDAARLSLRVGAGVLGSGQAGATLSFNVPVAGAVRLAIYDVIGRRVATLLDQGVPSGPRTISWSGLDRLGRRVSSGTYFARLEANGQAEVRKVLMVR